TLMCNTDSTCHNKSRLLDTTKTGRFFMPQNPHPSYRSPMVLVKSPLGHCFITSVSMKGLIFSKNTSDAMVESMRELRTAMCTVGLSMVNSSSGHPLYYALVTFCGTNNTVLEVSLLTINQLLKDLMKSEANVVVPIAAQVVVMFDQLQNHSALWDSLLAFPQLLSSHSVDQALVEGENLFTNLQGALHVFQESFPEAGDTLSALHILLTGGINLSRYVQKWPGRDVYISLGDVVMLQNDTISELTKLVLRQIEIPLDKAICLLLDPDTVRSYICNNSGSNAGLTAACMTGLVDTFLGWISPEKVATQALLMWSKSVAAGDLAFVKGLLHSVMGGAMKSPQDTRRSRRSVDADGPQNPEEDLFVNVGRVVLEVLKVFPDVDFVIQRILRTGLFSMHTANLAINTIENNKKYEYVFGPLTCERLLRPYDWLLHSECMDPEAWKALICQNVTNLEQSLAMEWWPLFQMVITMKHTSDNITLPMILSEWHKLCNNTKNFPMVPVSMHPLCNVVSLGFLRVMSAVASLGEGIERSPLWPHVGRYVYMTSWILNYKPGNTTEPAHCSFDLQTMDVYCNANVDWPQFVQVATQTMLSLPTQPEILIRCLKGTLSLLEHDSDISNPDIMLPNIYNLLRSTGLTPLMPLFGSGASINASTVLEVTLKLGRQNQKLFIFNESDPTLPDLERLIMNLLSMEGNLTLPLSLSMGHTLLTYSGYLRPEDLASLQLAIQPYTNQTSAGFTEAVLSAIELLNTLTDAPGGDPTNIIVAYVQQLQQFLISALKLRRIDQVWLSSGQLSPGQVTDLQRVTVDLLKLLSPEGLQSLAQAGPNATQQLILQKLLAFLPVEVQLLATDLVQEVQMLAGQLSFCTSTGQDCVASLSEIIKFLQQVATMLQGTEGNVTIQIEPTNPFLQTPSSLRMAAAVFSLVLPQRDAQHFRLINQTLHFITLLMDTPQLTIAQAQDALRESHLTLLELEEVAALLGAANTNSLLVNIVGLVDVQQCFAQPPSPSCATGLISRVTGFLSYIPALRDESLIFALIPELLNKSIVNAEGAIYYNDPQVSTVLILNHTLANIMVGLHQLNLSSPELMQEIRVLQNLLELASIYPYSMPPFSNNTMIDAQYQAQLEIIQWYIRKLENITSSSEVSSLLYPIYRSVELSVAMQLASTNFSQFVSNEVTNLVDNLEYPIDGAGVNRIGLVIIKLVREQIKTILNNIQLQNDLDQSLGYQPKFNATTLNALSYQTGLYLDLIGNWMRTPNITTVFNSMLNWGNSSLNLTTPGNDIHQLLQLAYFTVVSNFTQVINKALSAAEQPGGLQSDTFSEAIVAVVGQVIQILDPEIPGPLQQNILAVTVDSLQLIVNPDMSFAAGRYLSLQILGRAEMLVEQILPIEVYITSVMTHYSFVWFSSLVELIQSLNGPLVTLTAELIQSINSSHLNWSVIQEPFLVAIERMVMAAGQTNGTLDCLQVLMLWEPVRAAAGLENDTDTLRAWCHVSLQPVLQSYAAAQTHYANLNISNLTPGAASVTAAGIAMSLRSLYHAFVNSSRVSEQLIIALSIELSDLQPLSSEEQAQWYQNLQEMQLQESLDSLEALTDELLTVAPFLKTYVEAAERAAQHLLSNMQPMQSGDISPDIFGETAYTFLDSLNLTDPMLPMVWGNGTTLDGPSVYNLMKEVVSMIVRTELFGDMPDLYRCMERFVAANSTRQVAEELAELLAWASETPQGPGMDVLPRLVSLMHALFRAVHEQLDMELPQNTGFFGDLALALVQAVQALIPVEDDYSGPQWESVPWGNPDNGTMWLERHGAAKSRRRRELPTEPIREPMVDFIELFSVDYPALFQAVSIAPSPAEVLETAHVLFANPDLNVVMKGTAQDFVGQEDTSDTEEAIDSVLGVLAYLTNRELLIDMAFLLSEGLPYSSLIKNITLSLAKESPGIPTSPHCTTPFTPPLLTHSALNVEPGQLCAILTPAVEMLMENLPANYSNLPDVLFTTLVGEPITYNIDRGCVYPSERVAVGEMFRDEAAFVMDVQRYMAFDPRTLHLLLNTTLPDNLATLSWLVSLRHCRDSPYGQSEEPEAVIYRAFCSMSAQQWYTFSLLVARHVSNEKLIYRLVMSEELQSIVGFMLQMTSVLTDMIGSLGPVLGQLQGFLTSIDDLNLVADPAFRNMMRGYKRDLSSRSMLTTMTRALCNNGMMALFGISKLTSMTDADPSLPYTEQREEMITKFKIPRDASPFCMNLYLEMVNTTGGAIAWAFLKPMLMGQILYTPDTPTTRAIMEKSNDTLREFANLKQYSADWIESSGLLVNSTQVLRETLPMLKNSLGNAFVKKFIEMQTDINVTELRETLSDFANMGVMLDKNKQALKQITVLSNLMVNVASCIKFDRYQGYDSAEEMDSVAQELAKNRDLYASVIFKLPSGDNRKPGNGSDVAEAGLPRKVSYTIRMHMDNVMRTDRVRSLYYLKDTHIDASQTMRYTRGFIYLQESIDRAIIATHAGHHVAEPAVQLQPFPYPCFMRDEYLEAISFVFPIMLMIAWVLFVADFVKKLVYERELRLHEYMKMMGVNPLSHFCAWFLDCAVHLLFTIVILTLVLKYGGVLPNSDGFLLFLFFCNYGLSIVAMSFLVSSFFDKTYIAGMTGSLVYVLCFFPFIIVMGLETKLSLSEKSALGLLAPTCFSYATQYVTRYEYQGEGIQWSNAYSSPVSEDNSSFGWMCWLLLIDSAIYFLIGGYIRMVFPGQYGLAAPWYFPVSRSFWADLCCACRRRGAKEPSGLFITNILQSNQPVFPEDKEKGTMFSSATNEEFRGLPVGVALHRLSKMYGERVALSDLSVSFYEGHVTSLLGHNGAGKTTTMSLLTGLFAPSSGSIEVYGRDMLANIEDIRKELGVCMQYDVLFDHMTTKEHLLLYGQIKAPHWTEGELREQVRKTLEETGMHAHRHKRVGTLSGGMKRKLSISIAFIGGSRLVVLDEPTTGVDPCSRRSIWDIVIQHKTGRTIVMSTHHLDEAEVLSDRIAFLQSGGLKCCGSPFQLKDRLGQGYKLTLTRKAAGEGPGLDNAELKAFIQAHVPEARLKEAQGSDLVYTLPPFTSSSASSYRSLLSALDGNLDALQLGCYGISDTTLEEVHQEHHARTHAHARANACLTGSPTLRGAALVWQQAWALLVKRFQHSRRDWKGMLTQILLPVVFVVFAMGLGSVKSDMEHFPEMELSPALYNIGPSYSFFSNRNANSSRMVDAMLSYPGIDNACLDKKVVCTSWRDRVSKCLSLQVCAENTYKPPHKKLPSSQTFFNLTGLNVEHYLIATTNEYIRNRYGGFEIGQPIPAGLQMDLREVPKDRSLAKVWYNPDGHHSMPAYLNSLNNLILRSNLPADQDKEQYGERVHLHISIHVHGLIQLLVAICVMTGYAITTSSFAIYEVHEHHSGAKRMQHISGIGEPLYWTVNFLYDMTLYLIPVFLTVGVIAAFQIPAFTDRQNLSAVTLLLVLFGFSTFPWMYLLAGVFKDAEMAFISYVCINLFISINTVLPTSILFFMSQISVTDTEAIQLLYNRLSRGLLVFPQFSFGNGLMELARNNMEVQLLSGYGVDAYREPFSAAGLGPVFLSAFLQGLVFFALRLLLNRGLLRKVWRLTMGKRVLPPVAVDGQDGQDGEDEDVTAEHARVSSGEANSDLLQVCRLSKVYQYLNKKVHAVNQVSLGIPAGECFGLLGVNGAGKTTTFKMLTGDVSPTDGTAQIKDVDGRMVDIMECRDQGINIGYCPQVDALDNLLTGKEHLYFYARIRGISKREIDGVVNHLLKKLELVSHRDAVTEGYSCGTRRKLSTALALIGHPQILLLDEPSSGMDPRTKRHLWKIISEEVKGKCAVVLTSHSMEECEALCSRLAIMVKGQFRCLGSLQHIKNRFGSGFTVKMYLALASCDVDVITSFMRLNFPSTYLKEQHSTMVEYHVPVAPGGVADIFHQLETNKNALHIKHFSISQTTLDEVFINFAMGKIGTMDTIPIHNEEADSLDPFGLMPV
uniref:ATP binding cassette subfamily A member 12 n=1 Tax=Gadus morhua TaxID=8049 RepID=A0A8C5B9N2_GADMO